MVLAFLSKHDWVEDEEFEGELMELGVDDIDGDNDDISSLVSSDDDECDDDHGQRNAHRGRHAEKAGFSTADPDCENASTRPVSKADGASFTRGIMMVMISRLLCYTSLR